MSYWMKDSIVWRRQQEMMEFLRWKAMGGKIHRENAWAQRHRQSHQWYGVIWCDTKRKTQSRSYKTTFCTHTQTHTHTHTHTHIYIWKEGLSVRVKNLMCLARSMNIRSSIWEAYYGKINIRWMITHAVVKLIHWKQKTNTYGHVQHDCKTP